MVITHLFVKLENQELTDMLQLKNVLLNYATKLD